MRSLSKVLLPVLVCLLLPGWIVAQGQFGALTGSIVDSSGGVIAQAPITITNVNTGAVWNIKASTAGYYRLPVPPGTYRVEVKMQGFKTATADNIVVPVAQVVTIDLTLQVGRAAESVTVTAEAPLLTTATAEVGSAVTPLEFQTLPIEVGDGGRNPQAFIFSSLPGTQGDTWQGSINGGQYFSHDILIDGLSIGRYDLAGGSMDEYSPGTDAIGEFKVQMTNYSAEYGDTGGGIANFSLKSGTNQFHGTAFDYNKNPVFNAAGLLANAFGTPKNNDRENNFGGTIGGPIRKDKTFFFFSYEGDRYRNFSYSGTVTIPTKAMTDNGDFSQILGAQIGTDALGRPIFKNEIYDPTTTRVVTAGVNDTVTGLPVLEDGTIRDPFPGNVIPPGEFSNATSTLLPMFPAPLFGGTTRNTPRFNGCCPILNRDAYNIKVDQEIHTNQRLSVMFGYYKRFRWHRTNNTFPPFPGQPINPTKNQITGGPQVRLNHTWTINDHSLNNVILGYNRFNNNNNVTDDAKYTAAMGIPGVPDFCFPDIRFASSNPISALIQRIGIACNNVDPSESYIYQDTFTTTRGKHSLKFGAQLTRYRYNTFEPGPQSGRFNFNSRETSLPGFTSTTGNPFASFVLGATDSATRSVYATEPGYRSGSLAFFAQDDFKVSAKLTLNLGVRWEIPLPKKEAYNRQSGFDPTAPNPGADNIPGALVFLGNCTGCINRTSFQDMYWKEVAPRLGVAYAISKNLVFRGGYGISFSPNILNNFGSQNLSGYNGTVTVHRSGTRNKNYDPVIFLTPLQSTALPAWAKVGLPAFAGTLPNLDPASFNGDTLDFLRKDSLAQPYTQNWSLGFQYELPHQIMVEANYIGAKGKRLLNSNFATDFNPLNSKYLALGDNLNMDFQDALDAGVLAPYGITQVPYPTFESDNWDTSVGTGLLPYPQYYSLTNNYPTDGSSSYHSLQIQARKNATNGLTFIASYTFSKTLTDTDSALYYPSYAVQDFYNRNLEKSIASFDHPQSLKLTWIYALPFGRGQRFLTGGGPVDRLISGWQITAIQQYFSGNPLYVTSSLNTGLDSGESLVPGLRGDVVGGVPQKVSYGSLDVNNGTQYLNPAAFADPPDSAGDGSGLPLRIGNSPRYLPQTRGPFHLSEDFGIIKDTRINERFKFQIRADMFNVFNRTGFGDPDTGVNDGSFGLIFEPAHDPRVIQLALRLNF
jgi:Carboxypeptidase regulatory-like domain/TonB dependent receptor-like, beta-barrel